MGVGEEVARATGDGVGDDDGVIVGPSGIGNGSGMD